MFPHLYVSAVAVVFANNVLYMSVPLFFGLVDTYDFECAVRRRSVMHMYLSLRSELANMLSSIQLQRK